MFCNRPRRETTAAVLRAGAGMPASMNTAAAAASSTSEPTRHPWQTHALRCRPAWVIDKALFAAEDELLAGMSTADRDLLASLPVSILDQSAGPPTIVSDRRDGAAAH